jgi:hypothetical protein
VVQRTKQLVVFQVYLLMMQLYFGVLNNRNAMDLYDPSQTHPLQNGTTTPEVTSNPLDKLQLTSTVPAKDEKNCMKLYSTVTSNGTIQ